MGRGEMEDENFLDRWCRREDSIFPAPSRPNKINEMLSLQH